MSKAPYRYFRRANAFSLTSLYSVATTLPAIVLVWAASLGTSTPVAVAQTPESLPLPSSEPEANTARELLEQARQRLIERGDLPASSAAPTQGESPQAPSSLSDEEFDVYRLGPGDSLFVNVLRFPELSFQPTLDLQGNVIVPLVGSLSLNGLTVDQARRLIQSELNRFVVDPEVDITLVAQRPVQVTIQGEVVKPGVYPLSAPDLNVALLSAGGITRLADLRTVRIRRTLADGSIIERDIDLFTPLRDSAAVPEIRLDDGDSIIVPALNAETIVSYDRNVVARSTLAQPQIVIRVLNYASNNAQRGDSGASITRITLPNGSDFLDALTTIGPNPDRADLGDVALVRFDPVQGRAVTQELDGKDALLGDTSQNPPLEHNDVVVIGRNLIGRISYALNTFTQPFRDVLGFLLFFDTLGESAGDLFGPGDNND